MRMLISALVVLALWLCLPATSSAGILDFFRGGSGHPDVAAPVAEARVRTYLEQVLGARSLKVSGGHGALTTAELKSLDSHITSRLERSPSMVVAKVESEGVTGIAAVAAPGIAEEGWDPAKGFLAYVQIDSALVFPAEADRALALTRHLTGTQALFGFAPEAGPLWVVTERYLSSASMAGGDSPHFAEDGGSYTVQAGEKSPEEEDIPAWVVRGLTDLSWKKEKPVEMGVLFALTRRPASTCVRLTHVAGVGPLGKALFKDAVRLKKDGDE